LLSATPAENATLGPKQIAAGSGGAAALVGRVLVFVAGVDIGRQ
jgi:hypothetical protein